MASLSTFVFTTGYTKLDPYLPAHPFVAEGGNKNLTKLNMNEDLQTIEDLELAEIAEQEMEIIMNSIPDSRSFDIVTELIKRFRDKLTD